MRKLSTLFLFLLLMSGCSAWEQFTEQAPAIEEAGQTAVDVGAAVGIAQPVVGLYILTAGGLIIAVGKMLSLFKKGK